MLSIVAAETSTLTIISIPGLAYDTNLTFLQVVMGYVVGRIIISFVLLPHYFRGELYTAYQLIETRFGPRLRSITAGLFLITRAAAEGVRVYAVSIVVAIALGTGEVSSIAIITILTLDLHLRGWPRRGYLDRRRANRNLRWRNISRPLYHSSPGSGRMARHPRPCFSCGKTASLRFHADPVASLHVLGRTYRRSFPHYCQPRHGSAHRATLARRPK